MNAGSSRLLRGVGLIAATVLVSGSAAFSAAPQAQAQTQTCVTLGINTVTASKGYGSTVWTLDEKSVCTDLFAAFTHSHNDKVMGWYKQSGAWKGGSKGFVAVTTADNGWKALLTSIKNGSTVRGQTKTYNQKVQYVW